MSVMVNVNGRLADRDHAVIPVFDHGFLYGEGIYETLRTYNGEPFLFERHMRRLRASADMIALPIPLTDREIAQRFADTVTAAGLGTGGGEAYIRLLVTRGVGELTYDPAACPEASVIVIAKPQVDPPADAFTAGVRASIVSIVRNHPATVNPLIKSNNLLNCALAMQEAYRSGAFEGIMRNYRGELAECTTANLFLVRDGVLLTPPLAAGLLAGITRAFVLEIAKDLGVESREAALHDDDLFTADEAFLTSTTRELVPITTVDETTIGTGRPGPLTNRLLAEYRARAQALTTPGVAGRTSAAGGVTL
jgi:branched-chain amino acid aminotransferase